jgi:hypothetical protein
MIKKYIFYFLFILAISTSVTATPPCDIAAPVAGTIIGSNCDSSFRGSVALSGLPATNWILNIRKNGIEHRTISGIGATQLVSDLDGGSTYSISVTDILQQCTSPEIPVVVPIVPCAGFSFSLAGTYQDYNNDGIVNLGDAIQCSAVFNIEFSAVADHVTVSNYQTGESQDYVPAFYSPYEITIPGNNNATFTSTYVITQRDINLGFAHIEALAYFRWGANIENRLATIDLPLDTGDGLKLQAFIDTNGNGTRDFGEIDFGHALFHYERNNDGIVHDLMGSNGTAVIQESDPSAAYHLTLGTEPGFESQYTIGTTNYNAVMVAAGSGMTTLDFAVSAVPFYDVAIAVNRYDSPRPGFAYANSIAYTNRGSVIVPTGTISFTHDSVLAMPFSPQGTILTPTGFAYTFYNLYPNETRYLTAEMLVPAIPAVNLGDMVSTSATIAIAQSDINPANNSSIATYKVIGSFDPNDKSEIHNGMVQMESFSEQDYLEYTIHFENTGTADTVFFRIEDQLDGKLDETTIRMVAASHDYILERIGNLLVWKFNYLLPPSNASATVGHGYVTFQVKPKPGYAAGDIIQNTADIYFDFNPAIVTNTTQTEFVAPLGTNKFETDSVLVYPNPAKDILNIESRQKQLETITIVDLLGKTVRSATITDMQARIDLSPLANGLYLVKITAADESHVFKIVKK